MPDRRAALSFRRLAGPGSRAKTVAAGLACLGVAGVLAFQQRDASRLQDADRQETSGSYQSAIVIAGRVERAPALGHALLVRAHAEAGLGRYGPAVADFRAALRRDPGNSSIHADLGDALIAAGDVGAGEVELEAALALDPLQ